MEPVRLWAAVEFTAQSGSTDALLGHAAQAGLHLTRIVPLPGGFRARCAAWHYRPLAALARQGHVRLRVEKRLGLFFRLRPLLRRTGLWAGLALFIPLLLWSQQFVWAVDTSTLTRGQAARAFAVLRQADLAPGASATEAKRTAGEYALLESGEFSSASLNFGLFLDDLLHSGVDRIIIGHIDGQMGDALHRDTSAAELIDDAAVLFQSRCRAPSDAEASSGNNNDLVVFSRHDFPPENVDLVRVYRIAR